MTIMKFLPPRLQMPFQMLVVGAVGTAVGVIFWGWAAVVLGRGDERQAYRRLQMQALGARC